jgi:hypothetical protein
LLAAAAAGAPDGRADAFAEGLDRVRALAARQRWVEGRKALDRLLEEHARAPYVFAGRGAVEEIVRGLARGLAAEPPEPKAVVTGRLLAYDPRAGTIRILYTRETMGDWTRDGAKMLHPAVFDGPHSIVIRGARYPKEEGGWVDVCVRDTARIVVGVGLAEKRELGHLVVPGIPATLQSVRKAGMEDMAGATPSPLFGEAPFVIRVDVEATAVSSAVNGKRLQRGKKNAKRWGSLGFSCLDPDEVEIAGKVDPAWMDGLLDRARKRQAQALDPTWNPEEHLPAWLVAPSDAPAGRTADRRDWPMALEGEARATIERAVALANAGNAAEALGLLDSPAAAGIPEASREHLRSILLGRLGRWEASALSARKVREADADFVAATGVEAKALAALGKGDDAVALYRDALARFPGDADLHAEAANFLGSLGKWEAAETLVGEAASRGLASPRLSRAGLVAHRTRHGPAWPRRHAHESRHYDVESDINERICFEAAQILEAAYSMFLARLERAPPAGMRFRVFLFSDEAGYQAHVKDMLGRPAHGTGGLYAPALQQLLIWDPGNRDVMIRAVRHEGFHQYLHRIMPDPPRWFDEGLAEYFEGAKVVRGEWSLGAPRREHLDLLVRTRKPLDEFLFLDARGFYADPRLHYAEAWAFVHFLLHHTPWHRELLDRFWDAFRRVPSQGDAVREALADCPLKILDADFEAYVRRLRESTR